MNIYDQLQAVEDRYEELGELLSDPDVVSDTKRFMELSKEEASTRDTVTAYREYKQVLQNIVDAEEMIKESGGDADLEEMAKQELKDAKAEKEEYEEKLKILLLPKDPNDDKNIILEIRGAAGGDEAALFAGDLLTMYQKYAEAQGWRFEIMEASMNGVGGFKEVVAMVSGQSVYSKLKYESGAHRVQRVPVTESQGRVHTSTATVLVMPEVEEVEYDIDPKDLRVDIYHASGAGGQNVNKVATAVRIVHLPTNIKVEMQEERTQQKNREKAMKIIRARVADHFAQIAPLAFMRGRTLSDAVVILDEAQNTTPAQIRMFLTGMGWNTKMVITGDLTQIDLPHAEKSGLKEALSILNGVDGISVVNLDKKDIVRHKLVTRIVNAYEAHDKANKR